jgi:hypothetical protein
MPYPYGLVTEYLEREIAQLRDYFSMSEEERKIDLVHTYSHMLEDYIIEDDVDFDWPVDEFGEKEPDYQIVNNYLYNGNKDTREFIRGFGDYLYKKIVDDDLLDMDTPTWAYYSGKPEIVKNQWLIHFVGPNVVDDIAENGFTRGVSDMYRLGLTRWLPEEEKDRGGFNFAYLLQDFYKYGGEKYGREAVIFRASGVRVWHIGDEEYQVIFFGKGAKDRIPIKSSDEHYWAIADRDGKNIYGHDDLRKVVEWVSRNYDQYRGVIVRSNHFSTKKRYS